MLSNQGRRPRRQTSARERARQRERKRKVWNQRRRQTRQTSIKLGPIVKSAIFKRLCSLHAPQVSVFALMS
jgi:hypothetical protein